MALGIVGSLLVMLLLFLFAIRRKFESVVLWKPTFLRKDLTIGQEHEILFNLENIKSATRNFHNDNKLGEEALRLFNQMQRSWLKVDLFTFPSTVSA